MRRYVRTDKNGTKIYADNTCQRCGGQGARSEWVFTGSICYECGGTGISKDRFEKEYTPEYRAKLDERNRKKQEAKDRELDAQLEAEKPQRIAEAKAKAGFNSNDELYIVLGDSFSIKEQIKADGGKWNMTISKWTFPEAKEGYNLQMVKFDDVARIEGRWFNVVYNREAVLDIIKLAENKGLVNEYVGTVGDKLQIEVTVKAKIWYDNQWGSNCIIIMADSEGHEYKWNSSCGLDADKGSTIKIKGTIKAHEEYQGTKQTILTRCKEVK